MGIFNEMVFFGGEGWRPLHKVPLKAEKQPKSPGQTGGAGLGVIQVVSVRNVSLHRREAQSM